MFPKETIRSMDGEGNIISTPINPTEPCTFCGHSECGGGRPYDSSHLPEYCGVCWDDDQRVKNTAALEKQSEAISEMNSLITSMKPDIAQWVYQGTSMSPEPPREGYRDRISPKEPEPRKIPPVNRR